MFRLLLAAHFAALTLAGPWLCCCTTTQFGSQLAADEESGPVPTECRCGQDNQSNTGQRDKKPCDEAPCSAKLFKNQPFVTDLPVESSVPSASGNDLRRVVLDDAILDGVSVDIRASVFASHALPSVRLSCRETLRALHVLRC